MYCLSNALKLNIAFKVGKHTQNWHFWPIFVLRLRGYTAHDCLSGLVESKWSSQYGLKPMKDMSYVHIYQLWLLPGILWDVADGLDGSKIFPLFHSFWQRSRVTESGKFYTDIENAVACTYFTDHDCMYLHSIWGNTYIPKLTFSSGFSVIFNWNWFVLRVFCVRCRLYCGQWRCNFKRISN